jgi:hypothetical protein
MGAVRRSTSDYQEQFWHERRHIVYTPSLVTRAENFMRKVRFQRDRRHNVPYGDGDSDGEPFVSMHVRRGDFKKHHPQSWVADEEVVALMLRLCAEHLCPGE